MLIVDDSLTVRMDLDEAFREAGYETALCATLATAREAMKKTAFSLILLDVLLPDGDGVELLGEIKKSPATTSVPVMLLSTEAEVRDRIRGLRTGADEYVGKPYDAAYVVSRSRQLLLNEGSISPGPAPTTVLVVDDCMTFREELRSALESAKYSVITAATGEEGLRKAAILRPSIIIVDGLLPGIDGATVIRRLRSDTALRHTPCLLLTASEDCRNEVKALEAGADAYVGKETGMAVILVRLAAVLRSASGPAISRSAMGFLGPKKILAVDDSLTYLQELSMQLRQEGYDTVLTRSGEEALELLAVQSVDCILLDLLMPGLSGQETCKRIKDSPAWRDIPLIMLTALDESEAMIAGINAGADDYITKSGDFEVLKARVRAQLRRKQFEDENRRIREQLLQKELEALEARAAKELAGTRARLLADLKHKNEELESFSFSVSHDLRAPLRAMSGFSQALQEDYADKLDERGKRYLQMIRDATRQMAELIDALLELSRVTRSEMQLEAVDLSSIARSVTEELKRSDPMRKVEFFIADGLVTRGDLPLLRIVLANLLGNAWKYTSKCPQSWIEFGAKSEEKGLIYFVRDNGAGFDMAYVDKLFRAFQRLHSQEEFEGTGLGLATVQRIIRRHGGEVWADGEVGKGAAFYFTLPAAEVEEFRDFSRNP
ncbi:MAG: response regulator [Planctomycetes bacterium]|nr:response regulator [Planctomycetota bacterium]